MKRMAPSTSSPLLWVPIALSLLLGAISPTSASGRARGHLTLFNCPTECHCSTHDAITTLHCSSLDFINKLLPKDSVQITSLDLSNTSMHSLDKRLKMLPNLERLNLSNNKLSELKHFLHSPKLTHLNLRSNVIKSFSAKHLPHNLQFLELSHNYIRELPQDLLRLNSLKRIYVAGNPFTCRRESLDIRDLLLENKIEVVGRVLCHDPAKFKGHSWLHAVDFDEYFKLHDQDNMQADEMDFEGSGEVGSGWPIDELIPTSTEPLLTTSAAGSSSLSTESPFFFTNEGSGSSNDLIEGSGETDVHMNTPINTSNVLLKEGEIATRNPYVLESSTINPKFITENTAQSNMGTNIFLVIFLLCLVSLLIYAIKKNRDKKRQAARKKRNDVEKQNAGFELLAKKIPTAKHNGNPESAPLMSRQNQNGNSANEHEPSAPSEKDIEAGLLGASSQEPLGDSASMDLSPHLQPASPDVMSVKVKAAEIPESVPRTPILITRSKSTDGKRFVVTPNLNQRPSSQNGFQG